MGTHICRCESKLKRTQTDKKLIHREEEGRPCWLPHFRLIFVLPPGWRSDLYIASLGDLCQCTFPPKAPLTR